MQGKISGEAAILLSQQKIRTLFPSTGRIMQIEMIIKTWHELWQNYLVLPPYSRCQEDSSTHCQISYRQSHIALHSFLSSHRVALCKVTLLLLLGST